MNTFRFLTAAIALTSAACAHAQQVKYPPTRTVDASDTYFGKTYKDPYRWLENLKDKEVEAWFKAQADLTESILSTIPGRQVLVDEWMALDKLKPANYSGIIAENGRIFYKKTLGGENIGKLYVRQGWTGAEKLLFDPTTYPKDAKTVIQSFIPSWDGKHVAMALTAAGAEYSDIRVLAVDDGGTLLPETMYPSYGPMGWTADGTAFMYDAGKVTDIKSPQIELNRKTRLHKLGTPTSTDLDLFSNESCPELAITPREFVQAVIDESYPDYLLGWVGTVQAETRLFCAPVAGCVTEAASSAGSPSATSRTTSCAASRCTAITSTASPTAALPATRSSAPA
jgi:prolyl oligopeptidase